MRDPGSRPLARFLPIRRVAPFALLLAGGLVYQNSLHVPLLLDDVSAILANPSLHQLWPPSAVLRPPDSAGTGGRPLANLSFALNYAWGGTAVRGYHLTNLALHLLAALTLYGLVRRTWTRIAPASFPSSAFAGPGAAARLGLAVALLWVVHPLHTATVTYLSQRTEILMALCFLATLYSFTRAADEASRPWLVASVLACAAGMACKESMVTAPVLVWLYDRTFFAGSFRAAWRARRAFYLALAATWGLLAMLLTTGLHERHLGFGLGVTAWTYALTSCQAIITYLRLAVWPHPLVFDYGPTFLTTLSAAAPFVLLVGALLAGTGFALRRRPRLGFAAAAFFLVLSPTTSVVPIALQPIAENRTYLPLAAVLSLLVPATFVLTRRLAVPLLFTAAVVLGFLTFRRNQDFQSSLALWTDTVAKRPANPRAHDNLGQALSALGRSAEAIPSYQRALTLNPASATTYAMLGDAYAATQRPAEAADAYRQALARDPRRPAWRNNLGATLLALGQPRATLQELTPLVAAGTATAETHQNLGLAYHQLGDNSSAEESFRRSLALQAENPVVQYNYASLLARRGQRALAITHYREAARQAPGSAATQVALAGVLIAEGDLAAARTHCEIALRLDPRLAEAHNNLGVILVRSDRVAEARDRFAEAVRLKPDYAEAARNLAAVESALARPPR